MHSRLFLTQKEHAGCSKQSVSPPRRGWRARYLQCTSAWLSWTQISCGDRLELTCKRCILGDSGVCGSAVSWRRAPRSSWCAVGRRASGTTRGSRRKHAASESLVSLPVSKCVLPAAAEGSVGWRLEALSVKAPPANQRHKFATHQAVLRLSTHPTQILSRYKINKDLARALVDAPVFRNARI